MKRGIKSLFHKTSLARKQQERIKIAALGIVRAMAFLHDQGLIYRDLKPANVGFDSQGTVKLFDFGLARVVISGEEKGRRLTGGTGTLRYMANEVANHQDYSFPADVYSFGIVLWEVCTLSKPFGGVKDVALFCERVYKKHERPSLWAIGSPRVKDLLKLCWHQDASRRPTFATIAMQLDCVEKPTHFCVVRGDNKRYDM